MKRIFQLLTIACFVTVLSVGCGGPGKKDKNNLEGAGGMGDKKGQMKSFGAGDKGDAKKPKG